MELRQLELFCTLARFQNFTKAAEYLCITQPALTSQIASLERELEVKLITRTTRSFCLTAAGEILLDGAQELFKRLHYLVESVQSAASNPEKTIFIGIDSRIWHQSASREWVVPHITKLRKYFPDIKVVINSVTVTEVSRLLSTHKMDIAFMLDTKEDPSGGIQDDPCPVDKILLGISQRFSPSDIEHVLKIIPNMDLTLFHSEQMPFSLLSSILKALNLEPPVSFSTDTPSAFLSKIEDIEVGNTFTFMPSAIANSYKQYFVEFLQLPDNIPSTVHMHVLYHSDYMHKPSIIYLLKELNLK